MKVLLLPTEIAGQVNLTAQGLRKIGLKAYNTARPDPRNYPIDIDPRIKNPLFRNIRNPLLFFKWLKEFDLFHYNKSPYLPAGIDVKLLRKRQIPFVIEFWGSDIRLYKLEKERNPYFTGDNATNQERKINRLKFWSNHTDEAIFSDHSADIFLKPYFGTLRCNGICPPSKPVFLE